jgi:hypothetical protein
VEYGPGLAGTPTADLPGLELGLSAVTSPKTIPPAPEGNCFTLNRDFDPNAQLGNMILTEVGKFYGSCFTTDQPRTKSVHGRLSCMAGKP